MNIGCLFGTFDPPHNGHVAVAYHMLRTQGLDAVWLIVTPRNPFKRDRAISPDIHRLAMVRLAVAAKPGLEASDAELDLPGPNYTVDTLRALRARWPDAHFSLILGGDNLAAFHRWKDPEGILAHHRLLVYPRPGHEARLDPMLQRYSGQVCVADDAPLLDVSATRLRQDLAAGRPVADRMDPQVADYARLHRLYGA